MTKPSKRVSMLAGIMLLTLLSVLATLSIVSAQTSENDETETLSVLTALEYDANDPEANAGTGTLQVAGTDAPSNPRTTVPLTDADITPPRGIAAFDWKNLAGDQLNTFQISRSPQPLDHDPTDRDTHIIKPFSAKYTDTRYVDRDVIPDEEYTWAAVARSSDASLLHSEPLSEVTRYADWISAVGEDGLIRLHVVRHRTAFSVVKIFRYEGNDANADLIPWKTLTSSELAVFDNNGIPDTEVSAGNYYRYQLEYYDVPANAHDEAQVLVTSSVITAVPNALDPSAVNGPDANFDATANAGALTWLPGTNDPYATAYYLIQASKKHADSVEDPDWDSIGSTTKISFNDWEVPGDEFRRYRIAGVAYDGTKGDFTDVGFNHLQRRMLL